MTGPLRLRHRVVQAVREHALWERGQRVAVAVSGGLDSTVLLDLLAITTGWHGAELTVVTVHHGSPHADAHVEVVRRQAAALDLPLTVARVHPSSSSEAALRDARYAALDALQVDRVALAQHADDQAETVLLHLMRGTGVRGLAGMCRRRGRYVRPLLDEPRAALEAWARARDLRWAEDPTNNSPQYLRNRLRHEILPALERLRPGARAAMARSAGHAGELDRWIDLLADERSPPWEAAWIADGPTPVVRRVLVRALPGVSAASLDAIVAAARVGHGSLTFGRWHVDVVRGSVTVQDAQRV
ncbi:MAG: tRNA(Ile)-lysidine synthetase-like protein [Myxococcota bacterium]|jgi:tRNA(Ile)-lysidine synthetase-like protein